MGEITKNEGRFDINPHVIRQLGNELISDQTTALMELIKNSYDADSDFVKITIDTGNVLSDDTLYYKDKGYIIIEDGGFGMDRETLLKSWLTISYSNKRAVNGIKPKTPKGRTPLGDKGLGRLSTQRLARICEIITKKTGNEAFHVGFDWDSFDSAERLSDVEVKFTPVNFKETCGTKLVLQGLTDVNYLEGKNLESFKGALCQLISPYDELRPFNVYLTINGERIDLVHEFGKLDKLNVTNIAFAYSNRIMTFDMDIQMRKLVGNDYESYKKIILPDLGGRFLEYFFDKDRKRSSNFCRNHSNSWIHVSQSFSLDEIERQSLFNNAIEDSEPGDFFGRIQEFNFTNSIGNDSWTDLYKNFDAYKNFIKNQLGIKVYRNGFAVRPYGINTNDWLLLSKSWTGGSSFYGLRPGNVIGYVAIDEERNRNLKDKTDREGLIDNTAYQKFYKLIQEVVYRVNQEMENLRRSYNDFRNSLVADNTKIKSMKDALSAIEKQADDGTRVSTEYSIAQKRLEEVQKRVDVAVKNSRGNLFSGQENDIIIKMLEEVSCILKESKSVLAQANGVLSNSTYLKEALTLIAPKLDALENQLNDFSELASLGLISEMVSHDLGQISDRMLGKSSELEKRIKSNQEISTDQIYGIVDFIKSTVTSLKSQMKHLDSSMKYTRANRNTFSVGELLKEDELPFYSSKFTKYGIIYNCIVDDDMIVTMNKGKLIQVFDNLINNSIYWLNVNRSLIKETPAINIRVKSPWVYVEDNGVGIDPTVEESLFEPFITRKPEGEGRGLGLFIIRQLLDSINCDIILDPQRNDFGHRYRFSINLSSVKSN